MPAKMMTYAELATLWGVSREAARKKVEGLRLPRQMGNDGKARVLIDLEEVQHNPLKRKPETDRRPDGDRGAETEALKAHVQTLLAEVERLAALAETNRADFEQERERAQKLVFEVSALIERLGEAEKVKAEKMAEAERAAAETDRARAEAQAARAEAERVLAELRAWKSRPWWRRAFG